MDTFRMFCDYNEAENLVLGDEKRAPADVGNTCKITSATQRPFFGRDETNPLSSAPDLLPGKCHHLYVSLCVFAQAHMDVWRHERRVIVSPQCLFCFGWSSMLNYE